MSTNLLLQNILNGIAVGSVYAIFALGYTLIFSILRIINFAHGAVFTVGAYFTYVLTGSRFSFNGLLANQGLPDGVGLPFPLALIVGAILAGVFAVLLERFAFRPLRMKGADPLLSLVSSLGLAVAIVNLIQVLAGAEIYSYPPNPFGEIQANINFGPALGLAGGVRVRTTLIIVFFISLIIMGILTYIITQTKLGKALQAISEDTTTANLLGIDSDRLIMVTFFLSGVLGGIAGSLVAVPFSITGPYFGISFGLKGLAVIVLGGLGNIPGAIVGGLIIGLAENVLGGFLPGQYNILKDAIPFVVLFFVLLVRPQGILGRSLVQKV
jgi:branched-chain amino acid transport system permease protein